VEHLIDCLEQGQTPVATVADSRATLAACLAFYDAAKQRQAVTLS
jgi:hypothetical protein